MNIYTITKGKPKTYTGLDGKKHKDYSDKHIGKRYAAGIWCWNCRQPMFDTDYKDAQGFSKQFAFCRSCGAKPKKEKDYNPAMRELGFDKEKPFIPKGINGASGFTWCVDSEVGLGKTKAEIIAKLRKNHPQVCTEYGEKMSIIEFFAIFDQVLEEKFVEGEFS